MSEILSANADTAAHYLPDLGTMHRCTLFRNSSVTPIWHSFAYSHQFWFIFGRSASVEKLKLYFSLCITLSFLSLCLRISLGIKSFTQLNMTNYDVMRFNDNAPISHT